MYYKISPSQYETFKGFFQETTDFIFSLVEANKEIKIPDKVVELGKRCSLTVLFIDLMTSLHDEENDEEDLEYDADGIDYYDET